MYWHGSLPIPTNQLFSIGAELSEDFWYVLAALLIQPERNTDSSSSPFPSVLKDLKENPTLKTLQFQIILTILDVENMFACLAYFFQGTS